MNRLHAETQQAITIDALNAIDYALDLATANEEHPAIINKLITIKLELEQIAEDDRMNAAREAAQ